MQRLFLLATLLLASASAAPLFDWQTPPPGFDFRTVIVAPPLETGPGTQDLLDLFCPQTGSAAPDSASGLIPPPGISLMMSAQPEQPVPEPGTLALAAVGLAAGFGFARAALRRRESAPACATLAS